MTLGFRHTAPQWSFVSAHKPRLCHAQGLSSHRIDEAQPCRVYPDILHVSAGGLNQKLPAQYWLYTLRKHCKTPFLKWSNCECRWQPDGTTLDQPTAAEVASAAPAEEPVQNQSADPLDARWDPKERTDPFPLATGKMRSDFSVPELMGDPTASFSMGPEEPGEPRSTTVPRKVRSLCLRH